MELNLIRGPQGSGKTTQLRELLKNLGNQAGAGIIPAPHFTPAELTTYVMRCIAAGDTCVLIDDCSPSQLDHLRRMKRRADATGGAPNLTIHAAAQAN